MALCAAGGIGCHFFYPPRRVACPEQGVGVEHIPWSQGKRPVTLTRMVFLARDGAGLSHQLGIRLSLGGVVRGMGFIRTVQDLLGHKDFATTQLYTHVMQKPGLGVRSPLDYG